MSTKLWYNEFVNDWMNALPLGNGRVGAMVYGDPDCERIEINEESLWSGKQIKEKYHASPEALAEIRRLIFEEKLHEAAELARGTFLSSPVSVRPYESFGEIFIDFFDKSPYENYRKELELSEAMTRVSYDRSGVHYESECFVSEEDDILVYRVNTDGKPFSCKVTMERKQDAFTGCVSSDTVVLNGRLTFSDNDNNGDGGEGTSFGSKLRVITDGEASCDHTHVIVKNATFVEVRGAFATNYNVEKYDIDESIDYRKKLTNDLSNVENSSYNELKEKHIVSHKKWFENVSFSLESPDYSDMPLDRRMHEFWWGEEDPDLITLYYNFGRYLLIESSGKKATLPANLQGIWCHDFNPPWGSDFHTNINLQMNYWPAGCANLSEASKPFTHFMKMISRFGESTAKELFEARGWIVNHTTDPYGKTGVHDSVDCGFFPMAGPWLCLNLWEHYEYTGDIEYLKEIYPILKGSCEFVCDYLTEDSNGYLVTSPSNSPENEFYFINDKGEKKESMLTYGAAIDFQIIDALFSRTISATETLDTDGDFADALKATLKRLPPMKISERYGTIQEWIKDYEETEPGHRHISQLFGLYPADSINETNPEIYEAAKKTIARRIENGGGATGWSRAWTLCFYARLKDGANSMKHLRYLLSECTADNLFDIHPPFQIDGNFGGVAGITEMLLQSHLGKPEERIMELLPALPEDWKKGSIKGIKARGNFTVDIEWAEGKLMTATIKAHKGGILRIKENTHTASLKSNSSFTYADGIFTRVMKENEVVSF